jgi:hypothetical protein
MALLAKIVLACVIAVLVFLACTFVGGVLLASVPVSFIAKTGAFLAQYAQLFALVAGLWYFFRGSLGAIKL